MVLTGLISACMFPAFGLILSKLQFVLLIGPDDDNYYSEKIKYFIVFGCFCICFGLIKASGQLMFNISGEWLSYNVRRELMRGILYKQIQWFDSEGKAPGVLTSVLSEDVGRLNGMTTETLVVIMEALSGLAIAVVLALIFNLEQAIYTILCSPIVIVGAALYSKVRNKHY